jgi:SAM-dependent methyltransferase
MLLYEQRKVEDRFCQKYPDESLHGRFRAIVAAIPSGFRVLDVACGSGTLMAALGKKGCECVGIDITPSAVALCRTKGLDAHEGDVDAFESDSRVGKILLDRYDAVIFSKCLMYLRARNVLMRRLVTGHVIISQANPYHWKRFLGILPGGSVGSYLLADAQEIEIDSPGALMKWGASYGYRARRLHGGWLRGRDMVIQLSRPDRASELQARATGED